MKTLHIGYPIFDYLAPEGIPIHTSTLITGPGGSGKPLIGNLIVSAWLRQGGSVVFMSLQYPSPDFIAASLKQVANLDLNQYADRVAFISLDPTLEGLEPPQGNFFRANLVKPAVWQEALVQATGLVPDAGPGILVFGSAINLLLFSPTYGSAILETIQKTLTTEKQRTYLFSASTTAKAEEIARLEAVVDNLIFSRSERQPFRLYMQIRRMQGVRFLGVEVEVPFPPQVLTEVKEVAEHSRKRVIPQVSQL